MNRRQALKTLSLGSMAIASYKTSMAFEPNNDMPLVLCTWYNQAMANTDAWEVLKDGGSAIDAVEKGVQACENDRENCCVGLGGNPDRTGIVTLDACIMDDKHNIGSVAAIERIKNPIRVARLVMEKTPHVMLVGQGAQDFAVSQGFSLEKDELSDHAQKAFDNYIHNKSSCSVDYQLFNNGGNVSGKTPSA